MQSWYVIHVLDRNMSQLDATISRNVNSLSSGCMKLHCSVLDYCICYKNITPWRDVGGATGVNDPCNEWRVDVPDLNSRGLTLQDTGFRDLDNLPDRTHSVSWIVIRLAVTTQLASSGP